MLRSPCHECPRLHRSKNAERCGECEKRIKYVEALEGHSASIPVEMTDMASTRWKPEEVEFLRSNYESKTDRQIALEIGRAASAVTMKRMDLGLRKAASWRSGWERLKERKAAAMAQAEADLDKCPEVAGHADEPVQPDPRMAEPPQTTAPSADLVPVTGPDFALINFKQHEPIYERLKAAAERDFRTPELQALFYINQGLAREDGDHDQRRPADRAA